MPSLALLDETDRNGRQHTQMACNLFAVLKYTDIPVRDLDLPRYPICSAKFEQQRGRRRRVKNSTSIQRNGRSPTDIRDLSRFNSVSRN